MKMVPSCRYEALHGSAHMCHAYATEGFLMLASQENELILRKDHARELRIKELFTLINSIF